MGLVQRGADPDDQRAVCLYLSPQGRKIASKARSLRAAKLEAMLSTLTVDEQQSFLEMLEKAVPVTD
jgi:DNA-binding MarR family transcriptional regulator